MENISYNSSLLMVLSSNGRYLNLVVLYDTVVTSLLLADDKVLGALSSKQSHFIALLKSANPSLDKMLHVDLQLF